MTKPMTSDTPSQAARAEAGLDWLAIAKAAGRHGVRYRTNAALEAFLAEIASASPPAEALPSQTSGAEAGGEASMVAAKLRVGALHREVPVWISGIMLEASRLLAKPASEPAGGGARDWNAIARRMQRAGAPGTEEELEAALEAALSSPASSSPAEAQDGVEAVKELLAGLSAFSHMMDCHVGIGYFDGTEITKEFDHLVRPSMERLKKVLLSSAPAQEDGA